MHQRSDKPISEKRRGVITATALALGSEKLGLSGVADVVEFHEIGGRRQPFPIEYKRGRPKAHRADEVQLCAQALCLEDMLGVEVPLGALFYGQTRRRTEVMFDSELRALTGAVIERVREQQRRRQTPAATYLAARCDACSLLELCRPRLQARRDVDTWLLREIGGDLS